MALEDGGKDSKGGGSDVAGGVTTVWLQRRGYRWRTTERPARLFHDLRFTEFALTRAGFLISNGFFFPSMAHPFASNRHPAFLPLHRSLGRRI